MLAGVAMAAAWVWWFGLPGRGVTVALRPIDGTSALVVRGTGRDATLYRVDTRGTPIWRARVASFADPFVPFGGLAVAHGLVAYGVQSGHDGSVVARSLADGTEVWHSDVRWYDDHESVVSKDVFAATTSNAIVFVAEGAPARLTGLDPKDGHTRWRREVFGRPDQIWARGAVVVLAGRMNGESYRVDSFDGHMDSVGTDTPCVTDDEIVYQSFDRLTADSFVGGEAVGRHTTDDYVWLAGPCGERGDAIVALANGIDRAVLVGMGHDLSPLWRVELRGLRPVDSGLGAYADLQPLSHAPTRFVPLLLAERTTGRITLVVFDLDLHAVAWQSPTSPNLAGFSVYRRGDVSYVMDAARVAAIDGHTGEVLGAVRITGALPLQPYHVAGGRLWIANRAGDVTTLDARTFAPEAQIDGVVVNDERDAFAELLGRPTDEE